MRHKLNIADRSDWSLLEKYIDVADNHLNKERSLLAQLLSADYTLVVASAFSESSKILVPNSNVRLELESREACGGGFEFTVACCEGKLARAVFEPGKKDSLLGCLTLTRGEEVLGDDQWQHVVHVAKVACALLLVCKELFEDCECWPVGTFAIRLPHGNSATLEAWRKNLLSIAEERSVRFFEASETGYDFLIVEGEIQLLGSFSEAIIIANFQGYSEGRGMLTMVGFPFLPEVTLWSPVGPEGVCFPYQGAPDEPEGSLSVSAGLMDELVEVKSPDLPGGSAELLLRDVVADPFFLVACSLFVKPADYAVEGHSLSAKLISSVGDRDLELEVLDKSRVVIRVRLARRRGRLMIKMGPGAAGHMPFRKEVNHLAFLASVGACLTSSDGGNLKIASSSVAAMGLKFPAHLARLAGHYVRSVARCVPEMVGISHFVASNDQHVIVIMEGPFERIAANTFKAIFFTGMFESLEFQEMEIVNFPFLPDRRRWVKVRVNPEAN